MAELSRTFFYTNTGDIEVLQPRNKLRFGLFPLRSSLLGESLYDFSLFSYLDISVR